VTGPLEVDVGGRRLTLSNLDKVFYPATGFTKGQVVDYYTRIAPVLLPHLRERPLTLKRYPDGVEGEFFYEKQCPSHAPDWVETVPVRAGPDGRVIDFCVVNDLSTLVWLANIADLELHASLARVPDLDRPTVMLFDLDPGEPAAVLECARVALWLRDALEGLGLRGFPKTSGSKGIQVYVPLGGSTYHDTKPFAHALAQLAERQHPDLVVSKMKKDLRRGKVFVDWSQNAVSKTTVCVYSLRARERPAVSTPVGWDELEEALASGRPERLVFAPDEVLDRVARGGDLFAPVLDLRQALPRLA
jgi:bifunctional non-homologous end joining protein LigD